MIQGLAFMSHQIGSFLGAFGGGLMFDALGSYDVAWRLGVGMGLTAGVLERNGERAWHKKSQWSSVSGRDLAGP